MTVRTIAVAQPERVARDGQELYTAIFKKPVPGPVWVRRLNLEGDRQADPSVHGGEFKAVYAYSGDHYPWWRAQLGREPEPAQFGENLTIDGWDDAATSIGDVLRVGEAEIVAAEPRLPCRKLAFRLGDPHFIERFLKARRWGIYFRVRREGRVSVGDPVEIMERHPSGMRVYDMGDVYLQKGGDRETLARLAALEVLNPELREEFAGRLRQAPAAEGA
jgi:MOSC domain-containing protein YiiM